MLGNLDPALRSRLESISLIALFNTNLLTEYSIDDILKPFIEDLKDLNAVSLIFNFYTNYSHVYF